MKFMVVLPLCLLLSFFDCTVYPKPQPTSNLEDSKFVNVPRIPFSTTKVVNFWNLLQFIIRSNTHPIFHSVYQINVPLDAGLASNLSNGSRRMKRTADSNHYSSPKPFDNSLGNSSQLNVSSPAPTEETSSKPLLRIILDVVAISILIAFPLLVIIWSCWALCYYYEYTIREAARRVRWRWQGKVEGAIYFNARKVIARK